MSEAVEMPFGSEVPKGRFELPPRMQAQIGEIFSQDNEYYTREELLKRGINFDSLNEAEKREALAEHYLKARASHDFDQRHPDLADKGYKNFHQESESAGKSE